MLATFALASTMRLSFQGNKDQLTFVVTGDDRWDTGHPRPEDKNGVNVDGLGRLVKAILSEKADVVLWTGDTIGGAKTADEEAIQFNQFLKVVDPLYKSGAKVLVCRGNHEIHCPGADDLWRKEFSGDYANPSNGPSEELDMTYAYSVRNAMFISLDQFQSKDLGVNQKWLDQTLAKPHPPHIFTSAHKMAFFSGHHDDGMPTVPDKRDALIKSLEAAGERAIFFGHDHLYDHLAAKLPNWSDEQTMHQFVVGVAGAPFVANPKPVGGEDENWQIKDVSSSHGMLGYCVCKVDGPKVTIVFKGETAQGQFTQLDSYTYTLPDALYSTSK